MPRIAPALLVVGLLVATAAAFAVTERLKLVRSPIFQTQLEPGVFSPVCGCETGQVALSFRLRRADRLTVTIVDSRGHVVRTLLDDERTPAGPVQLRWNGRDDRAGVVPEGVYKPRIHSARQRRTIELPNPIRVDKTPPRILGLTAEPDVLSPDDDGRHEKAAVRYRLDEEGEVLLYVDGKLRVTGRGRRTQGKLDWFARAGGRGLPPRRYELSLVAVDRAGNRSPPVQPATVTIRYIEVSPRSVRVRAGGRLRVHVTTDAASYTWRLGRARGRSAPGTLTVRAPTRPGRYALVVEENGRRARASVVVEPRRAR